MRSDCCNNTRVFGESKQSCSLWTLTRGVLQLAGPVRAGNTPHVHVLRKMGCNKSKNKHVPVPWPLASYSRQEWIAWRSCFLTYMNEKYIPAYKQGNELFEYIGNIGLEISKNFYYQNASSETDVNTLLFKFDVYFIFGNRRKHDDESVDDYLQILKSIAEKTGKSNTEKIIKEKVLQDMKYEEVFEKFSIIVPSFSKISDYESLGLHELIFIWDQSKKVRDSNKHLKILEARKSDAVEEIQICDKEDKNTKCPSDIPNCSQCGLDHIQSKCPAFAKECSKCKKMNHFSWQCFEEINLMCEFCGKNHADNHQCPANNSVCYNCNKTGHFSFQCRTRRNSKSKR